MIHILQSIPSRCFGGPVQSSLMYSAREIFCGKEKRSLDLDQVRVYEYQVSEIFLPEGGVFRIYCHPGYYSPNIIIEDNIHGIEIDNYIHNWHIRKPQVEAIALAHSLLTVEVSDAHNLENIGLRYTEVELAELYRRAGLQG